MGKKQKNQGTQKITKFVDASIVPPPYDYVTNKSNTKVSIKNNKESNNTYICKCNDKMDSYKPKTWQSITKMYGDTDTTEVWDNQGKTPQMLFKSKKQGKDRHKLKQISEHNIDAEDKIKDKKSKHMKKNKHVKKSIISLYRRRHKKRDIQHSHKPTSNKNKQKSDFNENKQAKVESPIIRFEINKKPTPHSGTGDSCVEGPCREIFPNFYKQQKQDMNTNSSNKHQQLSYKNKSQISKRKIVDKKILKDYSISTEIVKNIFSKCNSIGKLFKHRHINKQHRHSHKSQNIEEPMFEMKVDSVAMRVLNSSEINDKVKNLGKIERKRSCICPSRIKSLKTGRQNVCAKGICETALSNNRTNFVCNCKGKNNLIACKDTNCDLKTYAKLNKKTKKSKLFKSSKYKVNQNKPLVEVILDRANMNILNSGEMENMFKNASLSETCRTGICNIASKNPDLRLKCNCIGKKMIPTITECTNETCDRTMKKGNFADIYSRVLSKSDHRIDFGRRNLIGLKKRPILNEASKKQELKQNMRAKSDTIDRNKRANMVRQNQCQGELEGWCECFCECDTKGTKSIKKINISEERKKDKKLKKELKTYSPRKKQKILMSKRKKHQGPWKQSIIKCFKRKRVHCERKLKEKEKEFKENEKKANEQIRKLQKNQDKNKDVEETQWNCLTKLVSGTLNLGIQLIKGIFSMVFSLLTNPIGSYIYVREKAKDPPRTIQRFINWVIRTWTNKSTTVSQSVKESHTMNVIADQIEDLAIYDALFANKGRTKAERLLYERKSRLRKRRMRKRQDEALYGCRHMLLTTMRKTPCLWFYHICPDLYPQCLNLLSFMTNFFHIIIFLLAFICWTPCIISFELCRAFLCCFFCTN